MRASLKRNKQTKKQMQEAWYSILQSVVCPRAPLLPYSRAGMGKVPVVNAKLEQHHPLLYFYTFR